MARAVYERIRERRIRNEWEWLRRAAAANPGRLAAPPEPGGLVQLPGTPYYGMDGAPAKGIAVRFEFPEYYPSVPLEAWLEFPVLHPNVHPENGFVCLWDTRQEGTSLLEAVRQLQRVVTWHLRNDSADHLMQPEAGERPPLPYEPVEPPPGYALERSAAFLPEPRRKRLS
jgi:ubiquitin-protein ligase